LDIRNQLLSLFTKNRTVTNRNLSISQIRPICVAQRALLSRVTGRASFLSTLHSAVLGSRLSRIRLFLAPLVGVPAPQTIPIGGGTPTHGAIGGLFLGCLASGCHHIGPVFFRLRENSKWIAVLIGLFRSYVLRMCDRRVRSVPSLRFQMAPPGFGLVVHLGISISINRRPKRL